MKKATTTIILAALLFGLFWLIKPNTKTQVQIQEAVKAVSQKAENFTIAAKIATDTAISGRSKVKIAQNTLKIATQTRIEAGFAIEDMPEPVIIEFNAMQGLITVLEEQNELESQRGDAWEQTAAALEELNQMLQEQQKTITKTTYRKGLAWGAAAGAAIIIVLILL
jgi:preprotein translocase subunit YajC